MSSPPTVYTDYCIFFEWETMKNYDSSGRFFLSKPHLMRFCLSHEVFSAVEGDPWTQSADFNYSKDISDILHPPKVSQDEFTTENLNKNGPKKRKGISFFSWWAFRGEAFCNETSGYVVSCCSCEPQLEKNPSDCTKKRTFSPKIFGGFLGNFRLGGWVGWPVLRGWFGLGFPETFLIPHFLVVWSGDDSWAEAAQCRGPRWCRVFPGCGDTRCVPWELPCFPPR